MTSDSPTAQLVAGPSYESSTVAAGTGAATQAAIHHHGQSPSRAADRRPSWHADCISFLLRGGLGQGL
ncbi:hypothetical protein EBR56_02510 [bacterium]|nr:hypothetical protein [bacterium]